MRLKPPSRARPILLALLILVSWAISNPLAHASNYVGYTQATNQAGVCPSTCIQASSTTNVLGLAVQSPLTGQLTSVSFLTANAVPSKVAILTFPVGTTPAFTTYSCGVTCQLANAGQTFTLADLEGLSGLSANTFTTVSLAMPVTVAVNQWIAIDFMATQTTTAIIWLCGQTCTNNQLIDVGFALGSTTPSIGSTFASETNDACSCIVGGTFQPSASGGGTVTVTQCYGNCGSPPITLVNTNSTHAIAFNQTLTLLYEFQSNLNGFLVNVTTNIARSYTNGETTALAVYTIASCPAGANPFTPQCPGLLQYNQGASIFNPSKGRFSSVLSSSQAGVPVSNGQWVGIAVTAQYTGLDLNDTNTSVNLFQTSEGRNPPSIQQASLFGSSKLGMWAWIVGNVVTAGPPTTPPLSCSGAGLDCILTDAVNSFCTVVTTSCQTGAGLFLVFILTIVSVGVFAFIMSEISPNINLGRIGLGEIGLMFFLAWFGIFGSLSLIAAWMLILVFFIVSWLFLGRLRGTGPI